MSDPTSPDNLTPRQRAFAMAYAGDGVAAARLAGYAGSPAVLASRAHKLKQHPGVRALIASRRPELREAARPPLEEPAAPPGASSSDGEGPEATADEIEKARAVARAIMLDPTALPSHRLTAVAQVTKIAREENLAENGTLLERQRAEFQAIIREQRQRERETGLCRACHRPLPRSDR